MSCRNGEFVISRGNRVLVTWDWSARRFYVEHERHVSGWFYMTVGAAGLHVSFVHVPKSNLS